MDLALAFVGLVLLLPLLVGVAVLVKVTSPGAVFFRQQREGLGGKLFDVYKFRSMRGGSDVEQITPLGHFLRKTSMDELPQLINVLMGDMSLVGPRPHVPDMRVAGRLYREVVPYYHLRTNVRPGLTGWAQANGLRGPIAEPGLAVDRINHDIAYIQNWSLALDCRILLRTLRREFSGGTGS
ncbi:sugar transferase [Devosia sp. CC-YST696]|nr:sugar transferase [Devosia faecipullorum]